MKKDSLFQDLIVLVERGLVVASDHAEEELMHDRIAFKEIVVGIKAGEVVEIYPDFYKGPCVLLLQSDYLGNPIHVLWGIRAKTTEPAVIITAYRPDSLRWKNHYKERKK